MPPRRRLGRLAVIVVSLIGTMLFATSPAQAIVDGSVVPGGWYQDPRPTPNPYGFVGRWEIGASVCTASLVAPEYVLTAGHCAGNAVVHFNMLNRDRDLSPGAAVVETRRVVEYWFQGDAPGLPVLGPTLLARLDRPVLNVAPVRMPDPEADRELWSSGHRLTVLGWGFINPSNTVLTAELRSAEEKVADSAITLPPLRGLMKMNHTAGYATHGDSGGPLVGRNAAGELVLVGIDEGAIGPGHQYFNRLWSQQGLIDFIGLHQFVATPRPATAGN